MLTKGAIGNLVNRYKAVLMKCNLINTFGSLAVASMLVLGGAGVAEAAIQKGNWWYEVQNTTTDNATSGTEVLGGLSNQDYPQNTTLTVENTNFENAHGGHYLGDITSEKVVTVGSSKVIVNATGQAVKDEVFGGSYIQGNSGHTDAKLTLNAGDTAVEFNSGTTGGMVVGGHRIIGYSGELTGTMGKSSVTVTGGTIAEAVVGGSLARDIQTPGKAIASATDTAVTITGGTMGGVIGGSISQGMVAGGTTNTNVSGTTSISISGGEIKALNINGKTFNSISVVGGGVATYRSYDDISSTRQAKSNTVNINISGGDFAGDIYAGAVIEGNNTNNDTTKEEASVASASVTISSTVKNVYLGGASINSENSVTPTITDNASITLKEGAKVQNIVLGNAKIDGSNIENKVDSSAAQRNVIIDSTSVEVRKIDIIDNSNADKVSVQATYNFNNECASAEEALEKLEAYNIVAGSADASVDLTVAEGEDNDGISKSANGTITKIANSKTTMFGETARQLYMTWAMMKNDLNKRMGELRNSTGTAGIWTRVDAGKQTASGMDSQFRTLQFGADKKVEALGNTHLGLAFSFTNADIDCKGGFGENNIYSLGAYGSWFGENGSFIDVIGKISWLESESRMKGTVAEIDSVAYSLSAEAGHRFNFLDSWFVEPQIEFTYGYAEGDDFTTVNGDMRTSASLKASESLTGRAGLRAGISLPAVNSTVYAHASVVSEFLGEIELKRGSSTYKHDFDDTWVEYGIGANYHVNKALYIYGDLQRTEGGIVDEEWRGTVGLRYSF